MVYNNNMKTYNTQDLQKKAKEILDLAKSGEVVGIVRGTEVYELAIATGLISEASKNKDNAMHIDDAPIPQPDNKADIFASLKDQYSASPTTPVQPTALPCCLKRIPCRHWEYNSLDDVWVNSITGDHREISQ